MRVAKGGQGCGVAVDDLALAGRLFDFDEFIAGGENGDAGPAVDRDEALLHGGEHGQFAGAAFGAGG